MLTTVAVFFPVVFVPGIAGILFRDMALTVTFALLCSLFVALTLIPLLASKILTVKRRESSKPTFGRLALAYEKMLRWALRHRKTTIALAAVIFLSSLSLLRYVGVEFAPVSEPGEFNFYVEMPVGSSIDVTEKAVIQAEKIVEREVPELDAMFARVGQGSGFGAIFSGVGSHLGRVWFVVKPINQRERTDEEIRVALKKPLSQIPGAKTYFQADPMEQTMFGGARLAVEIYGHDLDVARDLAQKVKQIMETTPGAIDVRISRQEGKPETQIVIDTEKAAHYGLSVNAVASAVQTAVMGAVAGQYREGGDEYTIRVRLPESKRKTVEDVLNILIPTPLGGTVRLSSVADIKVVGGPVMIERKGQQRMIRVTGNLTGERDLGSVVGDIRKKLAGLRVPPDFAVEMAGEAEEVSKSFRWLGYAFIGAVFLVYMVMASQFESLLHPFVIMFTLPLSLIGVCWMLFLTGTTLSVNSIIGVIVLAGIVVNNAIILVDYINLLRARGFSLEEAVVTGAKIRTRPILMTALTTILAMTPMALGFGEGSELNSPLARSVIGGLATSTVLTLVIIPVVYMSFENLRERLSHRAS